MVVVAQLAERLIVVQDVTGSNPVNYPILGDDMKVGWSRKYEYSGGASKTYAVIFDIDQVLADIDHRLHFITDQWPQDWDRFMAEAHKDRPIPQLIRLAKIMDAKDFRIFFVTGRKEIERQQTIDWLDEYLELGKSYIDDHLFMRRTDDVREDHVIKKEVFERNIKREYRILFVIEDRKSCVEMWRNEGLLCLQNEWGDF